MCRWWSPLVSPVPCYVIGTGLDTVPRLLTPELGLFALCALVGELVPLKVHTRGAEGEVTTSTCFALALLLAGGPAVAVTGLIAASVIADVINGKQARKIAFNAAQYTVSVSAASLVLVTLTDVPRAGALPFGADGPDPDPRRRHRLLRRQHRARRDRRRARAGRHQARPLPGQRPDLPGLDRRPAARPLARRRAGRRVLAARAAAAPAPVPRRPPRRPGGDRQGAPVAARRADRPAQPHALPRQDRAGDRLRPALRRSPPR